MKQNLLLFLCLTIFVIPLSLSAQKYTISGYISDAETGEKLIAANVFDQKSIAGSVSNNYGFYSLTLPTDSVILSFSYIGFQPQEFRLLLNKDITLDIKLGASVSLEVVEIIGEKLERIEETSQMSRIEVPIQLGALKVNVGLHANLFTVEGEKYTSLQPRLGLRYLLEMNFRLIYNELRV